MMQFYAAGLETQGSTESPLVIRVGKTGLSPDDSPIGFGSVCISGSGYRLEYLLSPTPAQAWTRRYDRIKRSSRVRVRVSLRLDDLAVGVSDLALGELLGPLSTQSLGHL